VWIKQKRPKIRRFLLWKKKEKYMKSYTHIPLAKKNFYIGLFLYTLIHEGQSFFHNFSLIESTTFRMRRSFLYASVIFLQAWSTVVWSFLLKA